MNQKKYMFSYAKAEKKTFSDVETVWDNLSDSDKSRVIDKGFGPNFPDMKYAPFKDIERNGYAFTLGHAMKELGLYKGKVMHADKKTYSWNKNSLKWGSDISSKDSKSQEKLTDSWEYKLPSVFVDTVVGEIQVDDFYMTITMTDGTYVMSRVEFHPVESKIEVSVDFDGSEKYFTSRDLDPLWSKLQDKFDQEAIPMTLFLYQSLRKYSEASLEPHTWMKHLEKDLSSSSKRMFSSGKEVYVVYDMHDGPHYKAFLPDQYVEFRKDKESYDNYETFKTKEEALQEKSMRVKHPRIKSSLPPKVK